MKIRNDVVKVQGNDAAAQVQAQVQAQKGQVQVEQAQTPAVTTTAAVTDRIDNRALGATTTSALSNVANVTKTASAEANGRTRAAAERVFSALRGGLWGMGVAHRELFHALEGVKPEEFDLVRNHYRAQFGVDLDLDLRGELSSSDLQRASVLLGGQALEADVATLKQALSGWSKDKGTAFSILERAAQGGHCAELQASMRKLFDQDIKPLFDGLSVPESIRAEALLAGDLPGARAHQLMDLLDAKPSMVRDDVILRLVKDGGPALQKRFAELKNGDMHKTIAERAPALGPQVQALLSGDTLAFRLAGLARMVASPTAHKPIEVVQSLLTNAPTAEHPALKAAVAKLPLSAELKTAIAEILDTGSLSLVTQLHAAKKDGERLVMLLAEVGTDTSVAHDYQQRYGQPLSDLMQGLDGLDRLRVEQGLRGPPKDLAEGVARLSEQRDLLRAGTANLGSRVAVDWLLLARVNRVEMTVARAEAALQLAKEDGVITNEEHAHVTALINYGLSDVDSYRDAVTRVGRVTSTLAGTIAAVTSVSATGGVASPLLLKLGVAALAGGSATGATEAVLNGRLYTLEKLRKALGEGATRGASMVIGQVVAQEVMHAAALGAASTYNAAKGAGAVAPEELTHLYKHLWSDWLVNSADSYRALYQTGFGAVRGAAGFAVADVGRAAVDKDTWSEGAGRGLQKLMEAAVKGMKTGAMTGSVAALLGVAVTGAERISLLPEGEAKDLMHAVDVTTPHGVQQVQVLGSVSPAALDEVQHSLQVISDKTAGVGLQGMEFVTVFNNATGGSAGICAGPNGISVSIPEGAQFHDRWTPVSRTMETIFHEGGHRMDGANWWQSVLPSSPFGAGPYVDDYAKTNALEDLAVTHSAMVSELTKSGKIDLDPATNPFAQKFEWVLQHFYPGLDVS